MAPLNPNQILYRWDPRQYHAQAVFRDQQKVENSCQKFPGFTAYLLSPALFFLFY